MTNTVVNGIDVSNNVFAATNDGAIVRIDVNHANAQTVEASGGDTILSQMTVSPSGCLFVAEFAQISKLAPCFLKPSVTGAGQASHGGGGPPPPPAKRPVSTEVRCDFIFASRQESCTVQVADLGTPPLIRPTGTATLNAPGAGFPRGATCQLSSRAASETTPAPVVFSADRSGCIINYAPPSAGPLPQATATYSGDSLHFGSHAQDAPWPPTPEQTAAQSCVASSGANVTANQLAAQSPADIARAGSVPPH